MQNTLLYLLPKIHMGNAPPLGRPTVSPVNSHTGKLSGFIDHFLSPCATRVQSYIKDLTHFLTTPEGLGTIFANSWLVILDVTSLYTNNCNVQGLHSAKEALGDFRLDSAIIHWYNSWNSTDGHRQMWTDSDSHLGDGKPQ